MSTYLKERTGPTSLKISFKFSSVASYGIFPTEKIYNIGHRGYELFSVKNC